MSFKREGNLAIEPNVTLHRSAAGVDYRTPQEWIDGYLAERQEPPELSLSERGLIRDCSKSLEMLFGIRRSDLVWQHVANLFPQPAGVELVQAGQVNPLLKYLCRCGHLYLAKNRQGDCISSNLSIVRLAFEGSHFLRVIVHPSHIVGA